MLAQKRLFLPGIQGQLQAILQIDERKDNPIIVVICHPHPLHQGTMDNKVVHTLSRTFDDLGIANLRFNYRGVGQSDGAYGEGEGETEDLLAVITWLQQHYAPTMLWLAGFSFGCYVIANAVQKQPHFIKQLFMVAPAVDHFLFNRFANFSCPLCIIHGDKDDIADYQQALIWQQQLKSPVKFITIDDAGHFFHRRLLDLRRIIHVEAEAIVNTYV